ncbi:MAG: VCBS repeat-containing protein [Planctomycetia bacterium]|nr:VCBS repeat-containing protein [Planctomycetia bacterium]
MVHPLPAVARWGIFLAGVSLLYAFTAAPVACGAPPAEVRWRKIAINDHSPFEACGVADFNGDGKLDIFCGDSWYEAPRWTRHKVRTVAASGPNPHYFEDFADCPIDCNGDGRPDIVTCNYFGRRVGWVENPGGDATQPWIEHPIDTPGNMETGDLVDINGDGRPDFLPNIGNIVAWYELTQKPSVVWTKHVLGTEGAGHGVGVGDINGDGRLDIITPKGWYEQPAEASTQRWVFHREFDLGAASVFILGRDVDGDGHADILWGMGHNFGLHWLQQTIDANGHRAWTKHDIDNTFSQVHTLQWVDLDGSGTPQLVTGKRVYAHEAEPGATDKPCIYSFKYNRAAGGGSGGWTRQAIFEGEPAKNAPPKAQDRWALKDFPPGTAGTGLQMAPVDIDGDGDLDLVCPGKSGLYLFENLRK